MSSEQAQTPGMVIFTRTAELVRWLLPQCEKFPKSHRFVVTARLQNAMLDFQESLFLANAYRGGMRRTELQKADAQLNLVRFYLRLAHEWRWLNAGQYQHVSGMVNEIGKLLGGWLKQSGEK